MTVTEPSGSATSSSTVAKLWVTLPLAGIVTVRAPVDTPKSPVCATASDTVSGADGAGSAVNVKTAPSPSVTPGPAATPTTGASSGGGSSSSDTATDAARIFEDTM